MPGNWHVRFGRRLGETGSLRGEHRAPSPPYWGHLGVTEIPNLASLCYRHHEMCHEGGWDLAWSDDGRLLTIPPSPSWPTPRGERAPTDADEEAEVARRAALDEALRASRARHAAEAAAIDRTPFD